MTITRMLNKEIRNLTLFSLGKLVSVFGSLIYSFAMSLYILKVTGDGLSFATNMVIGILPIVLISPIAGVLADRFNRKGIVILMDLLSGALLISLFLYINQNGLELLTIYLTTFVLTVFAVIFNISLESAKPHIVSEEKLMSINSISKIIDSTSSILAPILGGVIYALVEKGLIDIEIFIIINGISFLISAGSELFINFDFNLVDNLVEEETTKDNLETLKTDGTKVEVSKRNIEGSHEITKSKNQKTSINMFNNIIEGFVYLKRHKQLKSLMTYFIIINFFTGLSLLVPLPYIINEVLKLDSAYYGIIQGAFPVGMIIGSLVVKKVSDYIPYDQLLPRIILLASIVIMLIGIPLLLPKLFTIDIYYLVYYCLIMFLFGILVALIDIPVLYLLQKIVEDNYRGRVMSLVMSLAKIVSPIALLISGILINNVSPWLLPILGGGVQFIFALYRLIRMREKHKEAVQMPDQSIA